MEKKILILVLLLSAFIRLYRLSDLMVFVGDQGTDYLTSEKIITEHKFPLMLHETSQKEVLIGPFFYYFQAIALLAGNFNPVAPAVLNALLGVLSVILMYKLGKLPAAIFLAFSPLMVINSRIPIHVAIFPFFLLAYILALKSKKVFVCCLLFIILIQIHLSAFLLIPITLYHFKDKKYIIFISFFFLLSWLVAKDTVIALCLLAIKKVTSVITLKDLFITPPSYFLEVFQKLFSMETIVFGLLFLPFFLIGLKHSKKFETVWFAVALIGLLIKNSSAEHYFNLIIPAFFLIIAKGLECFKKIGAILLLLFIVSNLYFLPKNDYYMKTSNNNSKFSYGVPLFQRIEIATYMVEKSASNPFNIKVIGDFDIYPSTGKNYEYLTFWLNGKISQKDEKLKFIIYEPKEFAKIHNEVGRRKEFENAIVEYRPD